MKYKIGFKNRKLTSAILFVVAIIIANTFLFSENRFEGSGEVEAETFRVARVIDGDTIELTNGQIVRYIGIDTPETGEGNRKRECFHEEATKRNEELVEGKEVKLVKDVSEIDKYGRILRYVYIEDIFVNDTLVREGFAHAFNVYPDERYKDQFRVAEQEARDNERGLWSQDACEKI